MTLTVEIPDEFPQRLQANVQDLSKRAWKRSLPTNTGTAT